MAAGALTRLGGRGTDGGERGGVEGGDLARGAAPRLGQSRQRHPHGPALGAGVGLAGGGVDGGDAVGVGAEGGQGASGGGALEQVGTDILPAGGQRAHAVGGGPGLPGAPRTPVGAAGVDAPAGRALMGGERLLGDAGGGYREAGRQGIRQAGDRCLVAFRSSGDRVGDADETERRAVVSVVGRLPVHTGRGGCRERASHGGYSVRRRARDSRCLAVR